MGTGFAKRKKEQKAMESKMAMLQQTLASQMEALEVEGSAGNGLVTVTLSGTGAMKHISIQKECVDPEDIEGLQVLIKAAHQEAFNKIQETASSMPNSGLSSLLGM